MVSFIAVPHTKIRLAVALIFLSPMLNTASAAQQPAAHKRPAKAVKKAVPEPAPPLAPPPPPTPEQMPAVAPQVRYSLGQLTIEAENSTLGDILRAVRTQTGAEVEIPPNATERVVTHLGPGPARDVLAALLNGSHFNYVMVGSAAHPDSVGRLILTSKSVGAPTPEVAAAPPQDNNQEQMDDDPVVPPPDVAEQPVDGTNENPAGEDGSQPPAEGQTPVKTPEQLLHELQQQQLMQQQQQQQQQQNPPGAPPPQN